MTTLNWPTTKNPSSAVQYKNLGHISYTGPVVANFAFKYPNFRCHGNRGQSETSRNDATKQQSPENPFGTKNLAITS